MNGLATKGHTRLVESNNIAMLGHKLWEQMKISWKVSQKSAIQSRLKIVGLAPHG